MPISKHWSVLKIFGGGFGAIVAAATLFLTGYEVGQGHARAEASREISNLEEQISKKNALLSSGYTFESMTQRLPLQAADPSQSINIEKELEISVKDYPKTPLVVVIRRANDKVILAIHRLHYHKRDILRYYIPEEDNGIPVYLFAYQKSGNDDLMTILKMVPLKQPDPVNARDK